MTAVGSVVVFEAAPPLFVFTGAIGLYLTREFKKEFVVDMKDVYSFCGSISSIDVFNFRINKFVYLNDLSIEKTTSYSKLNNKDEEQRVVFTDDTPMYTEISINKGHRDIEQGNKITDIVDVLKKGTIKLDNLIEGSVTELKNELFTLGTYEIDSNAAQFNLSGVSNSNISGELVSSSSKALTLNFSFINPATVVNGKQEFSFDLVNAQTNEKFQVSSTLVIKGFPVTSDDNYSVIAGEGVYGELVGEYIDSFEILESTTLGELTILDLNKGQFGYDVPEGVRGTDSFTFVGKNQYGKSQTSTVTINVLSDCIYQYLGLNIFNPTDRDEIECNDDSGTTYNWFSADGTTAEDGTIIVGDIRVNSQWLDKTVGNTATGEVKSTDVFIRRFDVGEGEECYPNCGLRVTASSGYQRRENGSCVDCYNVNFKHEWQIYDDYQYWTKEISLNYKPDSEKEFSITIDSNSDSEKLTEFKYYEKKAREFIRSKKLMTEKDLILLEDNWGFVKPWLIPNDPWPLTIEN